jgi:hypothetical protein
MGTTMSTDILVRKLDQEVRSLRRDVGAIKAVLSRALIIPEESIAAYENAGQIRKAYRKALKVRGLA